MLQLQTIFTLAFTKAQSVALTDRARSNRPPLG